MPGQRWDVGTLSHGKKSRLMQVLVPIKRPSPTQNIATINNSLQSPNPYILKKCLLMKCWKHQLLNMITVNRSMYRI